MTRQRPNERVIGYLQHLANGGTQDQLRQQEGTRSHGTVSERLQWARRITGAQTTAHLVAIAVAEGWVTVAKPTEVVL